MTTEEIKQIIETFPNDKLYTLEDLFDAYMGGQWNMDNDGCEYEEIQIAFLDCIPDDATSEKFKQSIAKVAK